LRRLRGALGNAVVWAGTWFLAGFPLTVLFRIMGLGSGPFWQDALGVAQTYAFGGFLAGGAFSLYLGIAGRNQRLGGLKPGWIALGAALTVGIGIPALGIYFGNPQVSLASTVLISSILGGLAGGTAFGQVKIAQGALEPGEEAPDELDVGQEPLLSGPGVGVPKPSSDRVWSRPSSRGPAPGMGRRS
jgi:hypothetical protein